MPSFIIGGNNNVTTTQEVDPTFSAARMSYRPLDYGVGGLTLGHYSVGQRSGELAATIGALGHLASIRWARSDSYLVLIRLRVGVTVSAAITTCVQMAFRAIIVRSFTTDFTTAATSINMTTIAKSNAMRKTMGTSLMGTGGPSISTTTVMSGQTLTADTAPFAAVVLDNLSPTLGASAVTAQVGCGTPMTTLYDYSSPSQHPVVLSQYEGVVVQPIIAGPVDGTFALYCEWTWAEVAAY